MKFVNIALCQRSLNFQPEIPWPSALPPISWRKWLIAGFHHKEGGALELSEPCFQRAFQSCYPHLSLVEIARFYSLAENQESLPVVWEKFFDIYGLRDCDILRHTLRPLAQTPMPFQKWCHQRQLAPRDLAILRSLQPLHPIHPLLLSIAETNPSKSLGSEILYLGCELHLMGQDMKKLVPQGFPSQESPQDWRESLRQLRYPRASQRDRELALQIQHLPWPVGSEVRGVRSGDQSGFEVKFRIHSQQEFKKCLQGLEHTYCVLKQETGEGKAW